MEKGMLDLMIEELSQVVCDIINENEIPNNIYINKWNSILDKYSYNVNERMFLKKILEE